MGFSLRAQLTRERLKELLSYEPDTGHLRWRVRRNSFGGKISPGSIAGTPKDGYLQIGIDGRHYRAHRLIWLMMTGAMPSAGTEIDHRNGDRADNRWRNLRLVDRSKNNMNAGLRGNNKSGVTGVSRRADTGKWHARITVEGRIILLGNFIEKSAAIAARQSAEAMYFGEYRRT